MQAIAIRKTRAMAVAGALAMLAGACATTGATLGSGVGDRLLKDAPYVAGRAPGALRVAHLPVAWQPGASHEPSFDPAGGPGTPVAALLAEMNAYLDSLDVSAPLDARGVAGTPPDVRFGCEEDVLGECEMEGEGVGQLGKPWMRLAVGRPSGSWTAPVAGALDASGADAVLVLTLEVGQYWVHQRNLLGQKEVRLGVGHDQHVPWLTSLEQPASVLQLTGALVGRDGRAVRIGAEGLVARRTMLPLSAVGAQELVTDDDVRRLLTARRDDLHGRPLVWQAALRTLVAELTGRRELALR